MVDEKIVYMVLSFVIGVLACLYLTKANCKETFCSLNPELLPGIDEKYDNGAKCHGSLYRKTKNWCCSDYGRSKGYQWGNLTGYKPNFTYKSYNGSTDNYYNFCKTGQEMGACASEPNFKNACKDECK